MTIWQRIRNIISALFLILLGLLIILFGADAYDLVLLAYSVVLLFYGIRCLNYYLGMSRYMTGGRSMLYRSIIFIDLGLFALSLTVDVPVTVVLIYLTGILAFSGLVDIFRAFEARKIQGHWKLRLLSGIVTVLFAAAALIYMRTPADVALIYGLSLFYNAFTRLINAFRRTQLIIIQ